MKMLNCKDVTNLISQSFDRRLPFRQRLQITMHLWLCRLCSRFHKQSQFLHAAAKGYAARLERTEADSPEGLTAEARERIKRVLAPNGRSGN